MERPRQNQSLILFVHGHLLFHCKRIGSRTLFAIFFNLILNAFFVFILAWIFVLIIPFTSQLDCERVNYGDNFHYNNYNRTRTTNSGISTICREEVDSTTLFFLFVYLCMIFVLHFNWIGATLFYYMNHFDKDSDIHGYPNDWSVTKQTSTV